MKFLKGLFKFLLWLVVIAVIVVIAMTVLGSMLGEATSPVDAIKGAVFQGSSKTLEQLMSTRKDVQKLEWVDMGENAAGKVVQLKAWMPESGLEEAPNKNVLYMNFVLNEGRVSVAETQIVDETPGGITLNCESNEMMQGIIKGKTLMNSCRDERAQGLASLFM